MWPVEVESFWQRFKRNSKNENKKEKKENMTTKKGGYGILYVAALCSGLVVRA